MTEKWLGLTVGSAGAQGVALQFDDDRNPTVLDDVDFDLQAGSRPTGYRAMFERLHNYLTEYSIGCVAIKGSVVNPKGTTLVNLEAAELRGVIIAAAAKAGCRTEVVVPAGLRTFGSRPAKEYLKDDGYWAETLAGQIRKGNREAAQMILAARKR